MSKMSQLMQNTDTLNSGTGSTRFLAMVCFVASLGGILFGFDTAVISGTVSMVEAQFSLDKLAVGWFGSSALVGAILGSMVAGILGDRYFILFFGSRFSNTSII
jgi:MFS transporter, SP family, arabinose:H+ symporter